MSTSSGPETIYYDDEAEFGPQGLEPTSRDSAWIRPGEQRQTPQISIEDSGDDPDGQDF